MSFKCADRIKEITTTEGTGAIQLEGAVSGFKAFSSYLVNNDTTYYSIEDTLGNWENGFGTYQTGTPDSILRTNIISSSNNNLIVNFATGNKNIFCTNPADGTALIQDDGVGNRLIETDADITTTGTTTSDSILVSNDFIYEAPGGAVTFQVRSLGDFEVFQSFNSSVNDWSIGIEKSFSQLFVPTIGDSFAINPATGFASEAFVNLEPGVFPNPGTAHFWENNIHLGTELVLFDSQQTLLDGVTSGEIIFKTNDTSNSNSIASRVFTRASGTTGNVDMVFESGTIGALSDTLVLDTNNNATFAGDITTTGEIIANGAASYVGIGPNQNIAYGDLVIGFPAGSNSSICLRESEVGGADFRMIAVASDNSARLSNYGTGEMNFANINADNFSFYTSNTTLELRFTESTNTWDFQANDITTTGSIIQTSGGIETKTQGGLGFGAIQSLVTGSSPQIVWAIKNDTADLRFGVGTGGDAYFLNYSDNNRLDFRNMSVAGGAETNVWRFSTSNATYAQLYFDTTDMNSDSAGTWDFSGNDITTTGEVSGAHINLKATTVASLPAAGSNTGDMYRVTDANAPSMGATVSGGGSANAMVWSNGTNWTVFGI
jgi:hypothetical protein